jgi:hypothetical protein
MDIPKLSLRHASQLDGSPLHTASDREADAFRTRVGLESTGTEADALSVGVGVGVGVAVGLSRAQMDVLSVPRTRRRNGSAAEDEDEDGLCATATGVAEATAPTVSVLELLLATALHAQNSPPVHRPHESSTGERSSRWDGGSMGLMSIPSTSPWAPASASASSTARQRHSSVDWHNPHVEGGGTMVVCAASLIRGS